MNTDKAKTCGKAGFVLLGLVGLGDVCLSAHGQHRAENPVIQNDFVKVSEYAGGFKGGLQALVRNGEVPLLIVRVKPVNPGSDVNSNTGAWKLDSFDYVEAGGKYGEGYFYWCREIWVELRAAPPAGDFVNDAVKSDPKHNEVLFENERLRVVRVHFGAEESGPMVDKRARVIIVLTDSHATVTLPDGHSEVRDGKAGTAGTVYYGKAGRQATNNVGTTELENIVVELKGK